MRGQTAITLALTCLLGVAVPPADAGPPDGTYGNPSGNPGGSRGKGPGSREMAAYDPTSVVTIHGVVEAVQVKRNPHMNEDGLHLSIKTDRGTYLAHVAPQWVMEQRGWRFQNGEPVTVLGATFQRNGEENIYAATLKRHGAGIPPRQSTLYLRDPGSGQALWMGRYMPGVPPQGGSMPQGPLGGPPPGMGPGYGAPGTR